MKYSYAPYCCAHRIVDIKVQISKYVTYMFTNSTNIKN